MAPQQQEQPEDPNLLKQLVQRNSTADKVADLKAMTAMGQEKQGGMSALGGAPIRGQGAMVRLASTQIGSPYVWADINPVGPKGGPGSGFDCSGLTSWAAKRLGINLPHSADQQSRMLPRVGANGLQPGDLVFFDYGRLGGAADHVGIFVGNGQMIAASSSADQVRRQSIDWDHFLWGGRLGR
jgi:cell wall-associated NlpC family hydrolase